MDLDVDGLALPPWEHLGGDQPLAALVAQLHRDLGHIGLPHRQPGAESSRAANRANPDGYSEHELKAALTENWNFSSNSLRSAHNDADSEWLTAWWAAPAIMRRSSKSGRRVPSDVIELVRGSAQADWMAATVQPWSLHGATAGPGTLRQVIECGPRAGRLGIDLTYPVYHYFVAAKHQEFALGGAAAELCCVGRMYHGSASLPPLGRELVAAFLYSFTRRVHRILAANGPGRSW